MTLVAAPFHHSQPWGGGVIYLPGKDGKNTGQAALTLAHLPLGSEFSSLREHVFST